jgi:hypothetical protein
VPGVTREIDLRIAGLDDPDVGVRHARQHNFAANSSSKRTIENVRQHHSHVCDPATNAVSFDTPAGDDA